jgi:predicted DNA-binding WGR domain protein
MTTALAAVPAPMDVDVELRLIDPARNACRLYGLTTCTTLFGEPCLRVQWGRIGHRRVRERSEVFTSVDALEERRSELLARRAQHGYRFVPATTEQAVLPLPAVPTTAARAAVQRDIVEAHGLHLQERAARQLVERWHRATTALASYLHERSAENLDLVDVSTLASMYVEAIAS